MRAEALLLSGLDPVLLWSARAALGLSLCAVAWIDLRRFEIDPSLCALAALGHAVLCEIHGIWAVSLTGSAWGLGAALLLRAARPAALGHGDVYLFALCGFVSGADGFWLWAAGFALLTLAMAWCLARRRGRRFRPGRGAVPAAPAACVSAAAAAVLL